MWHCSVPKTAEHVDAPWNICKLLQLLKAIFTAGIVPRGKATGIFPFRSFPAALLDTREWGNGAGKPNAGQLCQWLVLISAIVQRMLHCDAFNPCMGSNRCLISLYFMSLPGRQSQNNEERLMAPDQRADYSLHCKRLSHTYGHTLAFVEGHENCTEHFPCFLKVPVFQPL